MPIHHLISQSQERVHDDAGIWERGGQPTEQCIGGSRVHVIREHIANNEQYLNHLDRRLGDVIQHPQALICTGD